MSNLEKKMFIWMIITTIAVVWFSVNSDDVLTVNLDRDFMTETWTGWDVKVDVHGVGSSPYLHVVIIAWIFTITFIVLFFTSLSHGLALWWMFFIGGAIFQAMTIDDVPAYNKFIDMKEYSTYMPTDKDLVSYKYENLHHESVMPEFYWNLENCCPNILGRHIEKCGCSRQELREDAAEHKVYFLLSQVMSSMQKQAVDEWIYKKQAKSDPQYPFCNDIAETPADFHSKRMKGKLYMRELIFNTPPQFSFIKVREK